MNVEFTLTLASTRAVCWPVRAATAPCSCPDQRVRVWDFAAQYIVHTLTGTFHWVRAVTFRPDGRLLGSSSGDRLVHLWEPQRWRKVFTLSGHERAVQSPIAPMVAGWPVGVGIAQPGYGISS